MLCVVDSGSTKADWAVISDAGELQIFRTDGLNPAVQKNTAAVLNTLTGEHVHADRITHVYFYGSGCSTPELIDPLQSAIKEKFSNAQVFVASDLLGSAKALLGDEAGLVSILGTGSGVAYFDGQRFTDKQFSGGYLLGDEGSGFVIGRAVVQSYCRATLPAIEQDRFAFIYKMSPGDLLEEVYAQQLPNRYLAQFANFLNDSPEEVREKILFPIFEAFCTNQLLPIYQRNPGPVHFSGSIAYHFRSALETVMTRRGMAIGNTIKRPIEALMNYHLNREKGTANEH